MSIEDTPCEPTDVVRSERSSGQFKGEVDSMSSSPAVVWFLFRDYRYYAVVFEIPHYAGWAPIPFTNRKSPPKIGTASHPTVCD